MICFNCCSPKYTPRPAEVEREKRNQDTVTRKSSNDSKKVWCPAVTIMRSLHLSQGSLRPAISVGDVSSLTTMRVSMSARTTQTIVQCVCRTTVPITDKLNTKKHSPICSSCRRFLYGDTYIHHHTKSYKRTAIDAKNVSVCMQQCKCSGVTNFWLASRNKKHIFAALWTTSVSFKDINSPKNRKRKRKRKITRESVEQALAYT